MLCTSVVCKKGGSLCWMHTWKNTASCQQDSLIVLTQEVVDSSANLVFNSGWQSRPYLSRWKSVRNYIVLGLLSLTFIMFPQVSLSTDYLEVTFRYGFQATHVYVFVLCNYYKVGGCTIPTLSFISVLYKKRFVFVLPTTTHLLFFVITVFNLG